MFSRSFFKKAQIIFDIELILVETKLRTSKAHNLCHLLTYNENREGAAKTPLF